MNKMEDIKLVNVRKVFGGTAAVDDVSLTVERGEFLTLLGPSGSGKTTTLRMIAGFIQPTEGSIYIRGELVNYKPPYQRNTGMVFQNYSLFPHMTAYENIAFGLRMRKLPQNEIKKRVEEAFELIGLSGYEGRYPGQLSGGEQQRIALARALVIEPKVLLLDEPLSNLDLKLRQKMRLEIKTIQKKVGITAIYVTHDQEEALIMSDRLALMNKGRIMQTGTPEEIYEYPKNNFVADFIGETNFLQGKLLGINESRASVLLDDGSTLYASPSCMKHHNIEVKENSKVNVSIRPQKISITRTKPEDKYPQNLFRGRIEDIEYVGSTVKYHIRLDNEFKLVVEEVLTGSSNHILGEEVFVKCPYENCLIIPT